jgi:demethylmenaquinone methyltransferase/2-methoxy-6-polyprenyl-1,4-benzoquinol methylase
MRRGRRFYYDLFSKIYDKVIALHSADKAGKLRSWLLEQSGAKEGMIILDLCTGTGSVALEAAKKVGPGGLAVGLDFSWGMLKKAQEKSQGEVAVAWVEASAPFIPFKEAGFHVVLCSHAFYELRDWEKMWVLAEVKRVLKPGGRFLMMEHEEPKHPFVKLLYRVRLASMGSWDSKRFIDRELSLFSVFFHEVVKNESPTGNSKLLLGVK